MFSRGLIFIAEKKMRNMFVRSSSELLGLNLVLQWNCGYWKVVVFCGSYCLN